MDGQEVALTLDKYRNRVEDEICQKSLQINKKLMTQALTKVERIDIKEEPFYQSFENDELYDFQGFEEKEGNSIVTQHQLVTFDDLQKLGIELRDCYVKLNRLEPLHNNLREFQQSNIKKIKVETANINKEPFDKSVEDNEFLDFQEYKEKMIFNNEFTDLKIDHETIMPSVESISKSTFMKKFLLFEKDRLSELMLKFPNSNRNILLRIIFLEWKFLTDNEKLAYQTPNMENTNEFLDFRQNCEGNELNGTDHSKAIDQKRYKHSMRELKRLKSYALGPKMALCDSNNDFGSEEKSITTRKKIPYQSYSLMLNVQLPKEKKIPFTKKYIVEKIVAKRITQFGLIEYLVKWDGYSDKDNTWEPPSNFENLDLVTEFEKNKRIEKFESFPNFKDPIKMGMRKMHEKVCDEKQNNFISSPEFKKIPFLKDKDGCAYKKCMHCHWNFYCMDKFYDHISFPHQFPCTNCSKRFTTEFGLSSHLDQCLDIKTFVYAELKNKKLIKDGIVDEHYIAANILIVLENWYSAKCDACMTFVWFGFLKEHITVVHPDQLISCYCGFKGELHTILAHSFFMSHLPSETRPIILSSAQSKNEIIFIPKLKKKFRKFPCFICLQIFGSEISRNKHFALCKLEKKFSCGSCSEKFALFQHLKKHIEWKHDFRKCDYCIKTFTSKHALTQHIFHTHKKPLRKSNHFQRKTSMSNNKNLKSRSLQAEPNKISENALFLVLTESDLDTSSSDNDAVVISLQDRTCLKCNDAFNTVKQLKVHSRMHTRELPHACLHCSQKFISRNLLLKHKINFHEEFLSSDELLQKYKTKRSSAVSYESSDSDENFIP